MTTLTLIGWVSIAAVAAYASLLQPQLERRRQRRRFEEFVQSRQTYADSRSENGTSEWSTVASLLEDITSAPAAVFQPNDPVSLLIDLGVDGDKLFQKLAEAYDVQFTADEVFGPYFPWKKVPRSLELAQDKDATFEDLVELIKMKRIQS